MMNMNCEAKCYPNTFLKNFQQLQVIGLRTLIQDRQTRDNKDVTVHLRYESEKKGGKT